MKCPHLLITPAILESTRPRRGAVPPGTGKPEDARAPGAPSSLAAGYDTWSAVKNVFSLRRTRRAIVSPDLCSFSTR
jgi:hypothetical protein